MYIAYLFRNKAVLVRETVDESNNIDISLAVGQTVGQSCGDFVLHIVKVIFEKKVSTVNPAVCCCQCLLLQLMLEVFLLSIRRFLRPYICGSTEGTLRNQRLRITLVWLQMQVQAAMETAPLPFPFMMGIAVM